MDIDRLSSFSGILQGIAVVAGATLAIATWWTSVVKKAAAREIGLAFKDTVLGLSSVNIEVRMASAVLMRRFFDKKSELGVGNAPFAMEAISSIAAVLRVSQTSEFQKVLADGLKFAPEGSLRRADLQRANLTKANLSGSHIDVSGADFFQANLSGATLRNIVACNAVFYEATLIGTRLKGANLSGANFNRALIENVDFSEAQVDGANFSGAILRNVKFSDNSNILTNDAIIQKADEICSAANQRIKLFVSRPGMLNRLQESQMEAVLQELRNAGCTLEQLERDQYDQTYVLSKLATRIGSCQGLLAFGFASVYVNHGVFRPGTEQSQALGDVAFATAWNHVEAGMALMNGIPVLLLGGQSVDEGVFDMRVNDPLIFRTGIEEVLDARQNVLPLWLTAVRSAISTNI